MHLETPYSKEKDKGGKKKPGKKYVFFFLFSFFFFKIPLLMLSVKVNDRQL